MRHYEWVAAQDVSHTLVPDFHMINVLPNDQENSVARSEINYEFVFFTAATEDPGPWWPWGIGLWMGPYEPDGWGGFLPANMNAPWLYWEQLDFVPTEITSLSPPTTMWKASTNGTPRTTKAQRRYGTGAPDKPYSHLLAGPLNNGGPRPTINVWASMSLRQLVYIGT